MLYLLPQQALKEFLVAGHLMLRPTACPAQGQGYPCGDFAFNGCLSDAAARAFASLVWQTWPKRMCHQAFQILGMCQLRLYLLPQQALKDFLVAGHLVLRPTACPAQGQGYPCGDFASMGTLSDADAPVFALLEALSGVAVLKDCQLPNSRSSC